MSETVERDKGSPVIKCASCKSPEDKSTTSVFSQNNLRAHINDTMMWLLLPALNITTQSSSGSGGFMCPVSLLDPSEPPLLSGIITFP